MTTVCAEPVAAGDWITVTRTRDGSGRTGSWRWEGVVVRTIHDHRNGAFVGVLLHDVDRGNQYLGADPHTTFTRMT